MATYRNITPTAMHLTYADDDGLRALEEHHARRWEESPCLRRIQEVFMHPHPASNSRANRFRKELERRQAMDAAYSEIP